MGGTYYQLNKAHAITNLFQNEDGTEPQSAKDWQ